MDKPENIILKCPYCDKDTIKAYYIPPMMQSSTSRAATGRKTILYQRGERYEILSGCSNCGKSQNEVKIAFKEGKKDIEKEKIILERLKQQGLPNEIMTKF